MLKIRLRRVGAKKQPSYRIVVADSRAPRDGRFVENIGFYNPRTEPATITVEEERALHWLSQGAQPTESVSRLLKKLGTLDRLGRLKSGESIEVLLKEAAAEPEVTESAPKAATKPEKAPKAAAKPESEPEAAPVADVEQNDEPEPEPEEVSAEESPEA